MRVTAERHIPVVYNRHRSGVKHATHFVTTVIAGRMPMPIPPSIQKDLSTDIGHGFSVRFEPIYHVIVHYSNWQETDTKAVSQRVKIGIPILTLRDCEKVVKHAFDYGKSIACTVTHEKALLYSETLMRVGINASIEEA